MSAINNGSNSITEVAQHVPSIGNLNSIWRTLAHAVRIRACAVACDYLDTWMLAEPSSERLRLPVRQEFHDPVTLQIDQNGTVTVAAAPGPVIHRKHAGRRRRGLAEYRRGRHSQQRIGTNRDGKPHGKLRSGFAAESERHVPL
jgi:hypothetical protein